MIDNKVFLDIACGLGILSANDGSKDTGCIINTLSLVAPEPMMVTIAVNKANYTCGVIEHTGKFNVSILSQQAPWGMIAHFGRQSGREVDKFDGCTRSRFSENGLRYHFVGTCGYLSGEVISALDLGSHMLFAARVTEAGKTSDDVPMTYAFFEAEVKPAE